MKSKIVIGPIILLTLLIGTPAVAATMENEGTDAGKTLTVDGDKALNFNFSPSVAGQYITADTSGNEQWYAIGTYHGGGSQFYATSAQQTSVYKKTRATDQDFEDAAIPATKADSESESQWTTAQWAK